MSAPEHDLLRQLRLHRPDAVIFDAYSASADLQLAVGQFATTMAIVDGDAGVPAADFIVDQNQRADSRGPHRAGQRVLAGPKYALVRSEFLRLRPVRLRARPPVDDRPLRVLVVMGGTDAFSLAPRVSALVAEASGACHITVVSRLAASELLDASQARPDQSVVAVPPGSHYPLLVRDADVVVSAAGSSTWELFCLGACVALVRVADNQRLGYESATRAGLAEGLGTIEEVRSDSNRCTVVGRLRPLLTGDSTLRMRLARAAWSTVDGLGAKRVASELLQSLR